MYGSTLLELATMISIARLGDNAYGVTIREDIESYCAQPVPLASVYAALDRLTRRRWLTVAASRALPVQGGRAKRLYRISATGRSLLEHEQLEWMRLFAALPREFRPPQPRRLPPLH